MWLSWLISQHNELLHDESVAIGLPLDVKSWWPSPFNNLCSFCCNLHHQSSFILLIILTLIIKAISKNLFSWTHVCMYCEPEFNCMTEEVWCELGLEIEQWAKTWPQILTIMKRISKKKKKKSQFKNLEWKQSADELYIMKTMNNLFQSDALKNILCYTHLGDLFTDKIHWINNYSSGLKTWWFWNTSTIISKLISWSQQFHLYPLDQWICKHQESRAQCLMKKKNCIWSFRSFA